MHDNGVKFWILYVVMVAAILIVGWNQPLRYRFMSKEEIAALHATTPAPQPGEWMWVGDRASKLDRDAYGRRAGSGYYPRYGSPR